MYDETARDSFKDGTKFCDHLRKVGIVAGIKVDKGVIPLSGT
jgi:fructose-bisphosphate aldolase class I